MAANGESKDENPKESKKVKQWLGWSWTYLWGVWFFTMIFLLYILRNPLKLRENICLATTFLHALTPKFYVALTATSSFISGVILVFELWYFRRYGTSFIEQMSVNHLGPWLSGTDCATHHRQSISECKVWRNPMNLFRGAEYQRYTWVTGKEPLTFYDMNLSSQDHQKFFTCEGDESSEVSSCTIMLSAWRERNAEKRIQIAHNALQQDVNCVSAYILLAEEEATTIIQAESFLKQALKAIEGCLKGRFYPGKDDPIHSRDTNTCAYIKRRLAMCARKLGRIKEAVKLMKELMKEFPSMSVLNIHENLIEALLEIQAYTEVQQVLAKYDDITLPKSATICYTAALIKARVVAEKFSPEVAAKRGLSPTEMAAVEAIHRAVEFNPHVPKYLLEQKSLILPPEHILKRGDSEALAYSFFHLAHWKRVDGALDLLHCTWEGTFRLLPYPLEKGHLFHPYPACTEDADKELLPAHHIVSVYPKRELPFFVLFTAGLCSFNALLALLTYQFPNSMASATRAIFTWVSAPFSLLVQKIEDLFPAHIWHQLTQM